MSDDLEARLAERIKNTAFACRVTDRKYSCMYCNKWWPINDPSFEYWRAFSTPHWMVRHGIVRKGDPMNVIDANTDDPLGAGYDPLGWFARCVDKDACARRRRNTHNGVQQEHLSLLDEIEHTTVTLREAMEVMA
jgi:hypothetical protein